MTLFLTKFGYSLFPLGAILFMFHIVKWRDGNLTDTTKRMVSALMVVSAAIGVCVGWFSVSRMLAPEGETHVAWMWDYKFFIAMVTGSAFLAGVILFIDTIEKLDSRHILANIALVVLGAIIMATA